MSPETRSALLQTAADLRKQSTQAGVAAASRHQEADAYEAKAQGLRDAVAVIESALAEVDQ